MPDYDYRCNDTHQYFSVSFKTYAEYNRVQVTSPFTGSNNVTRIISKVAIHKGTTTQWSRLEQGDPQALADLDAGGPEALGQALRHFGGQTPIGTSQDFKEVVGRLENGQTPDQIEKSMPLDD